MANERTAVMTEAQPGMVAAHQPGQDVFRLVLPESIDGKPFAAFPASVAWLSLWVSPRRPDPTRFGSECPMGLS